jgi:hypothetical protein
VRQVEDSVTVLPVRRLELQHQQALCLMLHNEPAKDRPFEGIYSMVSLAIQKAPELSFWNVPDPDRLICTP